MDGGWFMERPLAGSLFGADEEKGFALVQEHWIGKELKPLQLLIPVRHALRREVRIHPVRQGRAEPTAHLQVGEAARTDTHQERLSRKLSSIVEIPLVRA